MTRTFVRTLAWLVILAVLPVVVAQEPAPGADPEAEALERLEFANDLWRRKGDYNAALAEFGEAVKLAPDNVKIRIGRGLFYEAVAGLVSDEDRPQFEEAALADYRHVADLDPDSVAAGVARDSILRVKGIQLFPEKKYDCPDDAVRAYDEAEALFHQGRFEESLRFFAVATSACPANAVMLTSHADAYYMLKEYPRARELFREALQADPWHRMAHRFLADTETRLGEFDAGLRQAAMAVVADPTYEAAWMTLRNVAEHVGRDWLRAYAEKPPVTRGEDKEITISLPSAPPDEEDAVEDDPEIQAQVIWMSFAIAKAAALAGEMGEVDESGASKTRQVDPESISAIEVEQYAVDTALSILEERAELDEAPRSPGPFWEMMARADDAGFLTEAIYLHLMDENLAREYPGYRDANAERLVEYLTTVIVPAKPEDDPPATD